MCHPFTQAVELASGYGGFQTILLIQGEGGVSFQWRENKSILYVLCNQNSAGQHMYFLSILSDTFQNCCHLNTPNSIEHFV